MIVISTDNKIILMILMIF